MAVKVSKDTIIRRYAPDSVKFDDAKPGTLDQIKPGDQLRARGTKSEDGKEMAAAEIVSGTFRSIAAAVISTDAANNTHYRDRSGEQAAGDAEDCAGLADAPIAGDVRAAYRHAAEGRGASGAKEPRQPARRADATSQVRASAVPGGDGGPGGATPGRAARLSADAEPHAAP